MSAAADPALGMTMSQIETEIAAMDEELRKMAALEVEGMEESGLVSDSDADAITDADLPTLNESMSNVIVIDGLPKVPTTKVEKLTKVVRKIVSQFGKVDWEHNVFHMPMASDGKKTMGFAFCEFATPQEAKKARVNLQGWKLDKKHTFRVNAYGELAMLANTPAEYTPPKPLKFDRRDDLYWWLKDDDSRDQFVIRQAKNTEVYWIEGPQITPPDICHDGDKEQKKQGRTWCEMFTQWSPEGLYLATFHPQGLILWGGPNWRKVQRFAHPGAWKLQFSPDESFLVSWNGSEDPREKSIIVWDVKSGRELRRFAYNPIEQGAWPCFKWSHDGTMFARKGTGIIQVYKTPECKLLDKKSLRADGVCEFFWSPCGYDLKNGGVSKDGGTPVIGFWAPETNNKPAVVRLIKMPSRKELVSKNMFEVVSDSQTPGMQIHWQNAGEFLCVQVTRHSKTKRTEYTNFEIFRLADAHQAVPIEHLEMRQKVVDFKFEPNSHRFAFIYGDAAQRGNIDFYTLGGARGRQDMEKMYTLENKQVNQLYWSPLGNYIVLAGLGNINGQIEFWDVDSNLSMSAQEHFMCNHISWDPSGRVVCTAVCRPMFEGGDSMRYQLENGYNLWTFQGAPMYAIQKPEFYSFEWRPRPALLLSSEKQAEIKKNLKKYASKFDAREKIVKLRKMRKNYASRKAKYEEWMAAKRQRSEVGSQYVASRKKMGIVMRIEEDYELRTEQVEIKLEEKEEIVQ